MNRSEVILEIGAEGGSLTLYGARTASGWLFSRRVIDQTPTLLDDKSLEHDSELVDSWPAALELLAEYPWVSLYPIDVHPEFRPQVFSAVLAIYRARKDTVRRQLPRWKELCGVTES